MPKFTLFVAPGTCARVPTIALEEIGVPYETELVRLPLKEQKSPAFLAINPKGKVPALLIDGVPLTENVAILTWLNQTSPRRICCQRHVLIWTLRSKRQTWPQFPGRSTQF